MSSRYATPNFRRRGASQTPLLRFSLTARAGVSAGDFARRESLLLPLHPLAKTLEIIPIAKWLAPVT